MLFNQPVSATAPPRFINVFRFYNLIVMMSVLAILLAMVILSLIRFNLESSLTLYPEKTAKLNIVTGSAIGSNQPYGPLSGPDSIGAANLQSCRNYYFHNEEKNVGSAGNRKIADITPPPAGSPATIPVTLPFLSGNDVEIARFYSDPVLTGNFSLTGDIVGTIWLQTTNFNQTTFSVEIFDYNPANGSTTSLGDLEFIIITDGQNETILIITPPAVTIPAGHRFLLILYARSPILTSPTVTLFFDSADRDSQFTVCQIPPPELTVSKSGPAAVVAGQLITYTLTISNDGGLAATNLVISDTIPTGAAYVGGGTKNGNMVTWSESSLPVGEAVQKSFVVTAAQTITNDDYGVTADDNISANGQEEIITVVSQPGQPNLTISKAGPAKVSPGELINYTLTVFNGGDTAATNLIISDTIPAGATYVNGGSKSGNIVRWTTGSLDANSSKQFTFAVTAADTVVNENYWLTADTGISIIGQTAVTTIVEKELQDTYIPVIFKPGPVTTLVIQSENTGGINPVRVLDPDNGNNEVLSCVIGNNVTQVCGNFPAIGSYKIIAHTGNCGILQGDFNDATSGATVTRRIFCN